MEYNEKVNDYFEFVRFCLNDNYKEPESLMKMDWDGLFQFGREQTIMGILFQGIKKLEKSQFKPDAKYIMMFYHYYINIERVNKQVYKDAVKITKDFKERFDLDTCVMKGQANALMYPDPFMRTPGDIDLWVDAAADEIIKIARRLDAKSEIGYHHIQVRYSKTPVELHFFPSFMGNLFYEYRMRKYFNLHKKEQFQNKKQLPEKIGIINTLTPDFDRIFQMSHLMHHFFFEGIGLRQMIDYYYLLKQGTTTDEKAETIANLKRFNMFKFASAVMYIMKEDLGLDDKYLLMESNIKIGKLLEKEIILSGNFGFHDKRFSFSGKSVYEQYFVEIYRNLHFAFEFPAETIWGRPLSRWWHMIYKAKLRRSID